MTRCGRSAITDRYLLQRLFLLPIVAFVASMAAAEATAKTPGHNYCYNGICHRVKTIAETERLIGVKVALHASHYGFCKTDRFNRCGLTSSGEEFKPGHADNAASPIYPNGTKLLVWHPRSRKAAVVRINNTGPYHNRRTLDLSRATAEKLGFGGSGVSTVHAKVIAAPTRAEATYRANRKYPPVPGYIGPFETIEHAFLEAGRAIHNLVASPAHAVAGREQLRADRRSIAGAAAEKVAAKPPPVLKSAANRRAAPVLAARAATAAKPAKGTAVALRKTG
jgi:rare lipoprotein A